VADELHNPDGSARGVGIQIELYADARSFDRAVNEPEPPTVTSSAVLSPCGRYRYRLERRWAPGPALLWVMLNPSTADAEQDDATIRRVVGFTRREGFAAAVVCNLFGLRATNPDAIDDCGFNPVGPDNDWHIMREACEAARVVVAWGGRLLPDRPGRVVKLLAPRELWCLGTTAAGHPRHPLYVRGDQPLVPWRML
jgi:hypothetical protein